MDFSKLSDKQITIIGGAVMGVIALVLLFMSYSEIKKIGPYDGLPKILHMFAGKATAGKVAQKKDAPKGGKAAKPAKKKKGKEPSIASQILSLEKVIKQHNETIKKEEELRFEIENLQDEWAKLEKMLPKGANFAELMKDIVRAAKDYNIEVSNIYREDKIPHDAYTDRVRIVVENMKADYHSFGNFLYFLYVPLKRFIVLQDFELQSGAPDSVVETVGTEEIVRHKISMELVTFMEREE
jgi:Tfp pilus assembly protein PilO